MALLCVCFDFNVAVLCQVPSLSNPIRSGEGAWKGVAYYLSLHTTLCHKEIIFAWVDSLDLAILCCVWYLEQGLNLPGEDSLFVPGSYDT